MGIFIQSKLELSYLVIALQTQIIKYVSVNIINGRFCKINLTGKWD